MAFRGVKGIVLTVNLPMNWMKAHRCFHSMCPSLLRFLFRELKEVLISVILRIRLKAINRIFIRVPHINKIWSTRITQKISISPRKMLQWSSSPDPFTNQLSAKSNTSDLLSRRTMSTWFRKMTSWWCDIKRKTAASVVFPRMSSNVLRMMSQIAPSANTSPSETATSK